mmetsp:Transcript_734/g.2629  ORF Transcript_734/g.2629 Transcript_734/m.2629 type:complete len:342 (+) Transcript_734:49-1074(+)
MATALVQLAEAGRWEDVRRMLAEGVEQTQLLGSGDHTSRRVVAIALRAGRADVAEELIAAMATDTVKAYTFERLLETTAGYKEEHPRLREMAVARLQTSGMHVLEPHRTGPLLSLACYMGDLEAVQAVVAAVGDVRPLQPLHGARRSMEVAEYLLGLLGADVLREKGSGGTPIHWAARTKPDDDVGLLAHYVALEPSACSDLDEEQMSPLHIAVEYGNMAAYRLLREQAPDMLEVARNTRKLPAHAAVKALLLEEAQEVLLDTDRSLLEVDRGWTVLHEACEAFKVDAIRWIVAEFPSLRNVPSGNNRSPAELLRMHRMRQGYDEAAAALLGSLPKNAVCE